MPIGSGTLLGGGAGFAVMGPPGALLGAGAGWLYDQWQAQQTAAAAAQTTAQQTATATGTTSSVDGAIIGAAASALPILGKAAGAILGSSAVPPVSSLGSSAGGASSIVSGAGDFDGDFGDFNSGMDPSLENDLLGANLDDAGTAGSAAVSSASGAGAVINGGLVGGSAIGTAAAGAAGVAITAYGATQILGQFGAVAGSVIIGVGGLAATGTAATIGAAKAVVGLLSGDSAAAQAWTAAQHASYDFDPDVVTLVNPENGQTETFGGYKGPAPIDSDQFDGVAPGAIVGASNNDVTNRIIAGSGGDGSSKRSGSSGNPNNRVITKN